MAGSTFKEHLNALGSVMRSFRDDPNPLLRNLSIEYREKEMAGLMDEFINLSFDRLVEVLDPSPQKKSLPRLFGRAREQLTISIRTGFRAGAGTLLTALVLFDVSY